MSKKYPGGFITKTPVAPAGPFQDSAASGVWTLSQAAYWQEQGLWPIPGNSSGPSVIGEAFGGGFYAGQISTAGNGVADYYIIVGPSASAESTAKWKSTNTSTPNANSDIDGPQNTASMIADGNSTAYPAGHFCNDLTVGGFSDWYMPAKNELDVCYYNLKPSTANNNTSSGINPNAIPARTSNYTTGTPAQTSAADFQSGGTEDFSTAYVFWASTQNVNQNNGWVQNFTYGNQYGIFKSYPGRVRAIRRVPV